MRRCLTVTAFCASIFVLGFLAEGELALAADGGGWRRMAAARVGNSSE